MDRHKPPRNPYLFIIASSGLVLLAALVNIVPPDSIWKLCVFFLLFTTSVGLLCQYLLRNIRLSLLVSFGLCLFLILRFFDLRSPIYAALLLASILALHILK